MRLLDVFAKLFRKKLESVPVKTQCKQQKQAICKFKNAKL